MPNSKPERPFHLVLLAFLPPWLPTALIVLFVLHLVISIVWFLLR